MKTIKQLLLLFAVALMATTTYAQEASAALQVDATDKGFLMPRVTTAQRTAIASPAAGLQVYDTDTNNIYVYNGTEWIKSGASGDDKFVDGDTATDAVFTGGNVGIGTSNPESTLNVVSASYPVAKFTRTTSTVGTIGGIFNLNYETTGNAINGFGPRIDFTYSDGDSNNVALANIGAERRNADNSGALEFYTTDSGVSNINMYIAPNGDVGIGTSIPSTKLHVDGVIRSSVNTGTNKYTLQATAGSSNGAVFGIIAEDATDNNSNWILKSFANEEIIFQISNSEVLRMKSDGSIGIGTTSPGSKLAVVGLPEYADNTAASAVLSAGDFYRTADGTVKVVY